MFEKFLYPIMKNEPAPHPDVEHCPAVLAERAGKDAQEICRICEKCYDELVANQKRSNLCIEHLICKLFGQIVQRV